MPTTRPRHIVTETDDVAAALDRAARRWPAESRGRLVARVLQDWSRHAEGQERADAHNRVAAVREAAGAGAGYYGSTYLADQRQEWPS